MEGSVKLCAVTTAIIVLSITVRLRSDEGKRGVIYMMCHLGIGIGVTLGCLDDNTPCNLSTQMDVVTGS